MSTENVLRGNVRELQEQVSRLQARLAEVIAERDLLRTGRMLFWQTHPYCDYPIHDDEESMAEQFLQDMGEDMVADFKVSRAVELEPRMMRVYAPTDDESGVRWEWLP